MSKKKELLMINHKQHNVLIVDNDYGMREGLTSVLENEYTVLGVGEGKEAINVIKNNSIDVVILEIELPEIDGFKVLQRIKEINNEIIVILITAYGSKEIIIQALRLNADDYLDKPIDIRSLKTRIRSLLELKKKVPIISENIH